MSVKRWGISKFFFVFLLAFVTTWLTMSMFAVRAADFKVTQVIDGDTVAMSSGEKVRLLGIDAADNGIEGSEKAKIILEKLVGRRRVWVEGDRYGKDLYGRRLAWLWVGCESEPEFKSDKYMENLGRINNPWVEGNPMGCMRGVLVNEQLLKMGLVKTYFVEGDGELKYAERLRQVEVVE